MGDSVYSSDRGLSWQRCRKTGKNQTWCNIYLSFSHQITTTHITEVSRYEKWSVVKRIIRTTWVLCCMLLLLHSWLILKGRLLRLLFVVKIVVHCNRESMSDNIRLMNDWTAGMSSNFLNPAFISLLVYPSFHVLGFWGCRKQKLQKIRSKISFQ